MSAPARRFPSPGQLVVQLLLRGEEALANTGTEAAPVYHVGDPEKRPVELVKQLPYAWVVQGPGTRDDITDTTFVDVYFYTSSKTDDGLQMAERAADVHIRPRKWIKGFGVLDRVRVAIRPQAVPSGTTGVSCHLVQFQVSARRTGG